MALTAKQARGLVDAALKAAEERGYLIGVAVVDAGGNLVWSGRMDGARYLTPDIARAKATVSAAWRMSSGALEERANAGNKTLFFAGASMIDSGHLAVGQGAVPIWVGDECVGAIGASGAASHEDEECCSAALAAEGFKPPTPEAARLAASGHSR